MKPSPVYTGVALGLVLVAAADVVATTRRNRKMRRDIAAESAQQVAAIQEGAAVLINKMRAGEYQPRGINVLRTDLTFEQIIAYNKNK